MLYYFKAGGPFMWLLVIFSLVILALAVNITVQLFVKKQKSKSDLLNQNNAVLFWGFFSAVVGFFAHFVGIFNAFENIMASSDINPAIIGGGYAVSLITVLYGLINFMIAALLWFGLKNVITKTEN